MHARVRQFVRSAWTADLTGPNDGAACERRLRTEAWARSQRGDAGESAQLGSAGSCRIRVPKIGVDGLQKRSKPEGPVWMAPALQAQNECLSEWSGAGLSSAYLRGRFSRWP